MKNELECSGPKCRARSFDFRILLVAVAAVLIGCGTTEPKPEEPKVLTTRDANWVAALAEQPVTDPNRQCLHNSLQTAFALLALKEGGFDDKSIETALMSNLPDDTVRALRKSAAEEWLRTHEPYAAANVYLDRCLLATGNDLVDSDRWPRCFLATEPAAMFSIYRRTGRALGEAVRAITPFYPINADPGQIAELGRQVFALSSDAEDLSLREQIFAQCIKSGR